MKETNDVKISEIVRLTEARLITGNINKQVEIEKAFSSDLMSDVLTLDEHHIVLITGLANLQLIRTVEIADIPVVLLCRNKKATDEMIELAKENGLVLLETAFSIFRAGGILFNNGIQPVY